MEFRGQFTDWLDTLYVRIGKSLSEFVLGKALHAADEVIHAHEPLTLNEADWAVFLDALENPPEINPKLEQAFVEHDKRSGR